MRIVRGAAQAAETRRRKKAEKDLAAEGKTSPGKAVRRESEYQCGVCHAQYQEFTDTDKQWIGCDALVSLRMLRQGITLEVKNTAVTLKQ